MYELKNEYIYKRITNVCCNFCVKSRDLNIHIHSALLSPRYVLFFNTILLGVMLYFSDFAYFINSILLLFCKFCNQHKEIESFSKRILLVCYKSK